MLSNPKLSSPCSLRTILRTFWRVLQLVPVLTSSSRIVLVDSSCSASLRSLRFSVVENSQICWQRQSEDFASPMRHYVTPLDLSSASISPFHRSIREPLSHCILLFSNVC